MGRVKAIMEGVFSKAMQSKQLAVTTVEALTDPTTSLVLADPMVEEASGFSGRSERFTGSAKPAPLKPKGSSPFDHFGLSNGLPFNQMSPSD